MLSILGFKPRIFFVSKYDKIKRKKSFFCSFDELAQSH